MEKHKKIKKLVNLIIALSIFWACISAQCGEIRNFQRKPYKNFLKTVETSTIADIRIKENNDGHKFAAAIIFSIFAMQIYELHKKYIWAIYKKFDKIDREAKYWTQNARGKIPRSRTNVRFCIVF